MAGYIEERRDLETLFASEWGNRTPVAYDGQTLVLKDSANKPLYNRLRFTIINGASIPASAGTPGTNVGRYAGVIKVQIFTEGGKGTAASRVYEDAVCEIFRTFRSSYGRFFFRPPYVGESNEDPPFLVRTVTIPFWRDEFHL